jgi:hypothetical protein
LGNWVSSSSTFFLDIVPILQVAYRHGAGQRTELSDKRSPSLADYASDLEVCIATSFKLTLPSIFSGRATETSAVKGTTWTSQRETLGPPTSDIRSNTRERERIRKMKSSYAARTTTLEVLEEAKLVTQTMLATSVAFLDALRAFLSVFYDELTNDESKTTGKKASSLVCSIVRRVLDNIAVRRCLANFANFKNEVRQQVATEYLSASLQAHRVIPEYTIHEFRHHPSIAPIINCHLYRGRVSWSVFNDLWEEVSEARRLANEAKRGAADRLTPASCGGRASHDE